MLTDIEIENRRLALKLAVNENIPEPITTTTARAEKFLEFLENTEAKSEATVEAQRQVIDRFLEGWRTTQEFNIWDFAERFKAQLEGK